MSRLHLHVSVSDLDQAVGFYSTLFNAKPSVIKDDYAKWALDDPKVNFAISARARAAGIDHIGIQVDSADELQAHWFEGRQRVGLTAGASAPEVLVRQVMERIKAFGAVSVRTLPGIQETIKFPLPKGLKI